jgi:gamma-glutamyltranspeptidase/glutathione hydrolase
MVKLHEDLFRKAPLIGGLLLLFLLVSPVRAGQVAVATAHPLATQAGIEVLEAGGNAFDAAIAVTAVLAVAEPYSSGIGGGGFYLLHRARDDHQVMLDARETAPSEATRDMYLDEQGNMVSGLSINGPLAAGIPGIPAALDVLANEYGQLPLAQSLAPAIEVAEQGFKVDDYYRRMAGFRLKALRQSSAASDIFLQDDNLPEKGYLIKQPDLARTLRLMAEKGRQGFYEGDFAERMVSGVREAGGIWTEDDLAGYEVIARNPVTGTYLDARITAAAPPSSGGVVLISMLNILEELQLNQLDELGQTQRIVEAMRRAYRDRAQYLGDPDFVDMPIDRLVSRAYAKQLAETISPDRPTPSSELPSMHAGDGAGNDTTHFSIIDTEGNRVAATLSINYPFGACFVPPGTGVLLNDEMDDFSAKPGVPNVYGLVGAEANAIEPGKRMLSSMTPVFMETDDRLAVFGTPGGSRIITMVLLGGLEFMRDGSAEDMVRRPRFHHQYLPDEIQFEPDAFDITIQQALNQMGYSLNEQDRQYGNMQAIVVNKRSGQVQAASDPRGIGEARVRTLVLQP